MITELKESDLQELLDKNWAIVMKKLPSNSTSCAIKPKIGLRKSRNGCWGRGFYYTKAFKTNSHKILLDTCQLISQVEDIIQHEIIHSLGYFNHGKVFKQLAKILGVEGKRTYNTSDTERLFVAIYFAEKALP